VWIAAAAILVVAVSAVGVIVLGDSLRTAGTRTLGGRVTIIDTDPTVMKFGWDPGTCAGEGSFADVAEGASVVVMDQDGKTLAVGTLSGGVPARLQETEIGQIAEECYFLVRPLRVPGRDFYRVRVGRQAETMVAGDSIGQVDIRFGS